MTASTISRSEFDVKVCSYCADLLPLTAFAKKSSSRDGLQPYCRACQADYFRRWESENHSRSSNARNRSEAVTAKQRRANNAVFRAIKRGDIIKPETCSNPAISRSSVVLPQRWRVIFEMRP